MTNFWGKYRGKVVSNEDPRQMGRLQVLVPAVADLPLGWAMPCVPYGGPGVGLYAVPPVGSNVWVEFEEGDAGYPIWTGCFWEPGELPEAAASGIKLWQTEKAALMFDDERGELRATVANLAGETRLLLSEDRIVLQSGGVLLEVTADGIAVEGNGVRRRWPRQ